MFKKITTKGLAQGIVTGLVVTFMEGFFLLRSDTYIPLSYPLCLIAFNILFWMTIGGLSGLILWIFSIKDDFLQKEEIYRVVFFLLPFALLYGVLGRLFIPLNQSRPIVFDYHLSFVWVLGILIFKFHNTFKSTQAGKTSAGFFVFETAAIVMLFQFCSNIKSVEIFYRFYSSLYNLLKNITYAESFYFCLVYVVGVFFIVGLYFFTFRATTSLTKGKPLWRNYISIGTLFLGVVFWLGGIYIWQQRDSVKGITSDSVSEKSPAAKKTPYVILIVLDTVRADRMSVYDNTGTTKHLEVFSRDALVFENCLASTPWTVPSHASLFTGLYPSEHGVHIDYTIKGKIWGWPQLIPKLAYRFTTLAEIFSQNGYKTNAVVSNNILGYNLDQGFQHFDKRKSIGFVYNTHAFRPILHLFSYLTNIYPKHIIRYRTADDINKECFSFLERSRDTPFFLFINYLDAHAPYFPPRPFSGFGLKTAYPQLYKLKHLFLKKTGRLTQEQRASYNLSQYDGEIAFLDDQLGKLFLRLKKLNVYDSSLIIVTSDHGELFNEHGLNDHRCAMYQGVVRVPLLIKYPFSGRVGRVKKMIALTDLFTTILTACGLPLPDGIPGKTVDDIATPVVSEYFSTKKEFGEHRILYDGKYKYMKYEFKRVAELYNLSEDPMERENIVTTNPEIVEEMENKLKDWQNAHRPKQLNPSQQKVDLSQDAVQALKGLGYIQ